MTTATAVDKKGCPSAAYCSPIDTYHSTNNSERVFLPFPRLATSAPSEKPLRPLVNVLNLIWRVNQCASVKSELRLNVVHI